jgi:NTP pyrophosphatase (non-canonical NTP hydrolase)
MQESEHEALELVYAPMVERFDGDSRCYVVALDSWQIALLQTVLRYAYWPARWAGLGETSIGDVLARVAETENCLMAGCEVGELVDAIRDGFQQLHEDILGLQGEGSGIVEVAQAAEELEDDLANVWFTVKAVATILGATVGAPPTPL